MNNMPIIHLSGTRSVQLLAHVFAYFLGRRTNSMECVLVSMDFASDKFYPMEAAPAPRVRADSIWQPGWQHACTHLASD